MIKKLIDSDALAFLVIFIVTTVVFFGAFKIFFVQDDYILINEFSKNGLFVDFLKSIGPAEVTHWRPMHNLYFLITGNIFGRNYAAYHLVNILTLSLSAIFVYKTLFVLVKNRVYSVLATIFFAVNPSHFVSLYWISGSANLIGFLFFSISFYLFLKKHRLLYPVFFLFAILASEAFIPAVLLFFLYDFIVTRKISLKNYIFVFILLALFLPLKILLTNKNAVGAYPLGLDYSTLNSLRYYVLRIVGLPEVSRNFVLSAGLLLTFLTPIAFVFIKSGVAKRRNLVFAAFIMILGLIPFLVLRDHLSPHYMTLPIFGLSAILAFAFSYLGKRLSLAFILIFFVLSFLFVKSTETNNWVVKRSKISKSYIQKIRLDAPSRNSKIIFEDNSLSTSSEAYYSLGTGEAINFFFGNRQYSTCFTAFSQCK